MEICASIFFTNSILCDLLINTCSLSFFFLISFKSLFSPICFDINKDWKHLRYQKHRFKITTTDFSYFVTQKTINTLGLNWFCNHCFFLPSSMLNWITKLVTLSFDLVTHEVHIYQERFLAFHFFRCSLNIVEKRWWDKSFFTLF